MGAEAVFKIQNCQTALINTQLQNLLFKYHFDQRSELPNILQGKAYHGLDVLYLFMNLNNKLNEAERLARFSIGLDIICVGSSTVAEWNRV